MNSLFERQSPNQYRPQWYKALCVLVVLLLISLVEWPTFASAPLPAFNQLSCTDLTGVNRSQIAMSQPDLDILIPFHVMARPLLSALCVSPLLSTRYRDVVVHWQPRSQLTPQMIYQQRFDIMWGRDYHLAGLSPDYQHYYTDLLELPSYQIFWFSKQQINNEFLRTNRIGLLNDPFSRSGYQLPLQALKELAVDIENNVVYYPSRQAMTEALIEGEVDAISDTQYNPLFQSDSFYQSQLAQQASVGSWYFSSSIKDDASVVTLLLQHLRLL